jgi:hypothetical protein
MRGGDERTRTAYQAPSPRRTGLWAVKFADGRALRTSGVGVGDQSDHQVIDITCKGVINIGRSGRIEQRGNGRRGLTLSAK